MIIVDYKTRHTGLLSARNSQLSGKYIHRLKMKVYNMVFQTNVILKQAQLHIITSDKTDLNQNL